MLRASCRRVCAPTAISRSVVHPSTSPLVCSIAVRRISAGIDISCRGNILARPLMRNSSVERRDRQCVCVRMQDFKRFTFRRDRRVHDFKKWLDPRRVRGLDTCYLLLASPATLPAAHCSLLILLPVVLHRSDCCAVLRFAGRVCLRICSVTLMPKEGFQTLLFNWRGGCI